ncbi:early nodulin-like protein 3 [Cornus florida]|uniref:early nodulin-like protein 3 n=1 Tax=Cornus florida TaxID=4283 RepID=UPI00289C9AFF|nr:early nodulin-like protein 3 [Cornus florida]
MAFQRFLCLFLIIFTGLICTSNAYRFIVGGGDGWVLSPFENYNHWAQRNRFQVNDTLFFKYKNGSDSVLVVKKDDYDKCNTEKPIMKMDDGDSVFKFDRSGPFFFISGNKDNCQKGQKLIVVVLAVRNHHKSPPAPVGQTPASSPSPTKSSPSPAPATTPSPISHTTPATSPSPTGSSPSSAPFTTPVLSPSPISHTPPATSPISPSPVTMPPVSSPVRAMTPKSPYPATHSPVPPPTSVVSPAPSIAPVTASPVNTPTTSPSAAPIVVTPPSPSTSLPPATSSSGSPTADVIAPTPPRSSAPAVFTHSVVFVSWLSLVLSVAL